MVFCNDRRRLAEVFATAGREYSEAITRLVADEVLPAEEYGRLRSVMIEAQDRCDHARIEFEQHVAIHRCGKSSDISRAGAAIA